MLSVLSIQQQLWDRLRESRSLRARGFGCQPTTDHDILIVRNGHVYPKWMRWSTYNRFEERFDRYEEILNNYLIGLMDSLETLEAEPG